MDTAFRLIVSVAVFDPESLRAAQMLVLHILNFCSGYNPFTIFCIAVFTGCTDAVSLERHWQTEAAGICTVHADSHQRMCLSERVRQSQTVIIKPLHSATVIKLPDCGVHSHRKLFYCVCAWSDHSHMLVYSFGTLSLEGCVMATSGLPIGVTEHTGMGGEYLHRSTGSVSATSTRV